MIYACRADVRCHFVANSLSIVSQSLSKCDGYVGLVEKNIASVALYWDGMPNNFLNSSECFVLSVV